MANPEDIGNDGRPDYMTYIAQIRIYREILNRLHYSIEQIIQYDKDPKKTFIEIKLVGEDESVLHKLDEFLEHATEDERRLVGEFCTAYNISLIPVKPGQHGGSRPVAQSSTVAKNN